MTTASKGRRERRVQAKADKAAEKAAISPLTGEPPKAVITLTEIPNTRGGFTIGLGLHGARMEELDPGKSYPVSIVDVLALALTHVLRTQPKDFQDSVALVNATLKNVHTQIDEGVPVEEAMAGANDALAGAMDDIDAVPEAANAG